MNGLGSFHHFAQGLPDDLPGWVRRFMLALGGPLGLGVGLFVISMIDSSVLPLPGVNEALLVFLSLQFGLAWALFFAAMATLGSLAGCVMIYSIGYKGGEFLLRKRIEEGKLKGIHGWLAQNEFLAVLVSSFLPPPMPFKLFMLAAGGFRVRFKYFVAAILLGRSLRFFSLGLLGAFFGRQVIDYVKAHPVQVSLIALALIMIGYFLARYAYPSNAESPAAE